MLSASYRLRIIGVGAPLGSNFSSREIVYQIPRQRNQYYRWQSSQAQDAFPMPTSKQATPYEIFHLPRNTSPSEIKTRYYDLVKIYHPDRILAQYNEVPSSSIKPNTTILTPEKAHEDFKRVREAYVLLSNERKRRLYDRSGIGWDPINHSGMEDTFGAPVWKGGFPKTADEMRAYEAWSSSIRRGSPGSMNRQGWEFRGNSRRHDQFGWQAFAGDSNNIGSDWFYGYGHARNHANSKNKPTYTTNSKFFISLSFLTTILGIGQFFRVREESRMVVGVADRRHKSAAKSLDEARNFARSEAGRTRMEEMRRKARESALLEGRDPDAETNWATLLGHGGASGREAYEERLKRIGWSLEDEE